MQLQFIKLLVIMLRETRCIINFKNYLITHPHKNYKSIGYPMLLLVPSLLTGSFQLYV